MFRCSRCTCCLLVEVNGTTRWLWNGSPAVHATRVMRRELTDLMWLAAISNLVQTGMPLHTSRFPRCDSIARLIISRR